MTILIIALYVIVGFIVATAVSIYFFADDEVMAINFIAWLALWPLVLVVIGLCAIECFFKGKSTGGKG